ncbi:MAG: isochorismate synthase [Candidatus Eisenbacteria bacterium]|nr:isochorismate synthase [Candidatus Eisenbacteria bacterium]
MSPIPFAGFAEAAAAFLAERLIEPGAVLRSTPALVAVPAPVGRPEALLRALDGDPAFLWAPPEGAVSAGVGASFVLRHNGEDRLDALRDRAADFLESLDVTLHSDCPPFVPSLFGGLGFDAGGGKEEPWVGFEDGFFFLPRWWYARDGERAWLALTRGGDDDRCDLRARIEELPRLFAAIEEDAGPEGGAAPGGTIEREPERAIWDDLVEEIRDGIHEGRFAKVVLARRARVNLAAPADPIGVVERLGASYPDCYRFAVRSGDGWFVGATPERLVRVRGVHVATEALAGTIAADGPIEERDARILTLLQSRKDLGEHDIVVGSIRRILEAFCLRLTVPPRPQVRELENAIHLQTPMAGLLARPTHILDLVGVLHPTPSVGGLPASEALRWIRNHEPHRRGWYAAPVGRFDAGGEGDFAAAIRSGVIRGDRAWIYAGAGIVRDSEPAKEYHETRIKMAPLLRALGIAN